MADADANPSPKSDPDASPIPSISPSPSDSAAAADSGGGDDGEGDLPKQLADLAISDHLLKPSGWDTPEIPDGDGGAGEKVHPVVVVVAAAAAQGDAGKPRFPRRPGEPDCTYYVKFGSCRFGMKCKFNHPPRKKKNKVKGCGSNNGSGTSGSSNKAASPEAEQPPKEEHEGPAPEVSVEVDSLRSVDNLTASHSDNVNKTIYEKGRMEQKELKQSAEETDKGIRPKKLDETDQKAAKEKGKEAISDGGLQEECKYFSMPGGCKFGKACKYIHREGKEGKTEVEQVEMNFLGLPLRPGEKECPYYMRTGSCKFATNCKFHHPEPTAVGSKDPVSEHENGDAPQNAVQGSPQLNAPWPDQRPSNEQPVPFLAPSPSYSGAMIPPQGMYPCPEWNGYQVPVNPYYPPGIHFQHFPAPAINHPLYKAVDIPGHQQVTPDEYPERPGHPECQHYVKNGFCKFKMKCKYHHPKSRVPPSASTGALSPLGLPIKPDQPVCTYYGRYGICKFGPSCMYNHPFNYGPPVPAAGPPLSGQYPTPGNYTV